MANNNNVQESEVMVYRASDQAVFPFDCILSSANTVTVPIWRGPDNRNAVVVPTDLRLTIPQGTVMKLASIPEMSEQSILVFEDIVTPCVDAPLSVTLYNYAGFDIEVMAGAPIGRLAVLQPGRIKLVDANPQLGVKRKSDTFVVRG